MAVINGTSSLLIPAGQVDIGALKSIRDALTTAMNTAVRNVLGTDQPLVVRDLTANDINPGSGSTFNARLTNPVALTATTLTTLFTTSLTNQQAFGIYGYAPLAANPNIDIIQFGNGTAVTYARFNVDGVFSDAMDTSAFMDGPVFWTPNQTFTMQAVSQAGVDENAEAFVLYGVVVEPSGLNIKPVASA